MKLLVSVRSTAEAEAALRGGADIIDIKEPARGPLGMAPPEVCGSIVQRVAGRAPVSAALGELWERVRRGGDRGTVGPSDHGTGLSDDPERFFQINRTDQANLSSRQSESPRPTVPEPPLSLPPGLSFVKVGLAVAPRNWRTLLGNVFLRARPARPIAVAYADHGRAGAPPVCDILDWAGAHGAAGLLIDTAVKDGRSLFDFCEPSALEAVIDRGRRAGLLVALAGSLCGQSLESAVRLVPDIVAVRGAACIGLDRSRAVDERSVRALTVIIEAMNRRAGRRAG